MLVGGIVLVLDCVSKSFSGRTAIKDVSCEFASGLVYTVLGPNGAGKTVLSKIIFGVYPPDSGFIFLSGAPFSPKSPRHALASGVAYVPQVPYLPSMVSRRMLASLVDVVIPELPEDVNRVSRSYLELVIALARKPKVLLLDEPRFVESEEMSAWSMIRTFARDSLGSVIIVAHDMKIALGRSDRIIIMHDGKVHLDHENRSQDETKNVLADFLKNVGYPESYFEYCDIQGKNNFTSNSGNLMFQYVTPDIDINTLIENAVISNQQTMYSVLPGHRQDRGLSLGNTLSDNLILSLIKPRFPFGFFRNPSSHNLTDLQGALVEFDVKPGRLEEKGGSLSGGNKQRLAYARTFLEKSDGKIIINPFRGLDGAGVSLVLRRMSEYLKQKGNLRIYSQIQDDALILSDIFQISEGQSL